MTDDEVKQWLSEEERRWFARRYDGAGARIDVLLVRLAETRKALATCEWAEDELLGTYCPICASDRFGASVEHNSHTPDCIFAAMPRPR